MDERAKNRARAKAQRHVSIEGKPCAWCGEPAKHRHHPDYRHPDYRHPLRVVLLCARCHGSVHSLKRFFERQEQGRKEVGRRKDISG